MNELLKIFIICKILINGIKKLYNLYNYELGVYFYFITHNHGNMEIE